MHLPGGLSLLALVGLGCSSPEAGRPCVEGLDLACAPLYSPTFDQIYSRTLHPTCAQTGAACHAGPSAQASLAFDDPDTAYATLLGARPRGQLVVPGDPACSLIIERLDAPDAGAIMPPGSPLPDAERCAVVQWIQNGAKR